MMTRIGGGDRLRQERKRIGKTQKELALELDISAAYISLIETGQQQISEPIALKMQSKYGTNPRWLLYGEMGRGEKGRLRIARDQMGMKQKDMAAELGISAMYLGMMERGEQPISVPVALKMEKLYGFSARWILYGTLPQRVKN
ncbi:MAG: helix-turn-helix domain-containing protein [Clostridia bacterium]|nr:helix-turn-helix domain-containing protein [Clostridia bacterium]